MSAREGPARPEPNWAAAVTVRDDAALAAELIARLATHSRSRSVSVTDLLQPRAAYWKRVRGVPPPSPEREVRLEEGRRVHQSVGRLLAREGVLEARVHRGDVHGRVDLLTDRPVEVKSGTTGSPVADPVTQRPEHVDQVVAYAAILGVASGRLVYALGPKGAPPAVSVYDLGLPPSEATWPEIEARAARLQQAWTRLDPSALSRCAWFGRGCDFQEARLCDCTGEEPPGLPLLQAKAVRLEARPEVAGRLQLALGAQPVPPEPPVVGRFRDLIYPRRTYFERLRPPPPHAIPEVAPRAEPDLWRSLSAAIDAGPNGEVSRLPTLAEEPAEEVAGLRGDPYLLRTTRARTRVPAGDLVARSPQYVLDLGFRCAVTGRRRGHLILGYEIGSSDAERIRAFSLDFDPTTFSRLWRRRADALRSALAGGEPAALPACPAWMYDDCPYRAECGCGEGSPRSQR